MRQTQAPLPLRQAAQTYARNQAAADAITEQARRVAEAEDTWRMCQAGTHAEAAAFRWLQGHRETLAQMIVDAREGGKTITPAQAVRRWSWRIFLRSRAVNWALLLLSVAAVAAVLGLVINIMDGGWR